MHIFYIHQHFALRSGSTGTRSYEFARRWVQAGHTVTLITGNCDVAGLGDDRKLISRRIVDGINLVVVGARYSNKQSYLQRLLSFFYFMLFSAYVGVRTKGADVVYATSTPLTVGIPAILIKWLKGIPFLFEVRDQWPEVPIALGVIRNRFMKRVLLWLEKAIYRRSAAIVALSPGMAEGVRGVIGGDKPIAVIPNSSDVDLFEQAGEDCRDVRDRYGWGSRLVIVHFGTMSTANGLHFLVDAAKRCRDRSDLHFVLVGDGNKRAELEQRIADARLDNIQVLDRMSKMQLVSFIRACDVATVVFADYPILEHNSANKLFDSLSAGKPVLLNYSGWQRQVLEDARAGFGCLQWDLDEYVQKVLWFADHRDELEQMGRNAKQLAVDEFNRDKLATQALDMVSRSAKPSGK